MQKKNIRFTQGFLILVGIAVTTMSGCLNNTTDKGKSTGDTTATTAAPTLATDMDVLLIRFDSLDFDVYSHQKWDQLQVSHAEDVLVHYPDGSTTKGLHDHIEALKPMFVFAPDTKITEHPVKFGTNGWTSVVGSMEGTFTQPMPTANGKTIPPTGKKFKLSMNTVGHWQNGKMIEEYLFWDNQSFMKQIGLNK